MRVLFLLFVVLLVLFQTVPGNSYPSRDTLECKTGRGFCKYQSCPGESQPTGGTCEDGFLICCKWPWSDYRRGRY